MNATDEISPSFEDLSRQLEEVLKLLERGDLPLEEALKAYESGVILVRQCNDLLDGAELRISELSASVTIAKPSRFIPSEMLFPLEDDEE